MQFEKRASSIRQFVFCAQILRQRLAERGNGNELEAFMDDPSQHFGSNGSEPLINRADLQIFRNIRLYDFMLRGLHFPIVGKGVNLDHAMHQDHATFFKMVFQIRLIEKPNSKASGRIVDGYLENPEPLSRGDLKVHAADFSQHRCLFAIL